MDSLTQAVLGAATYGSVMGKAQGRKALWIGAALGTLPDLDVLIPYADPISQMTYHRGWSHSLFILLAFSWLLAWLWQRYKKPQHYSLARHGSAISLALLTHPLIDAMTMYGTQLWYPFTPPPTSWATVFIIDPLYTLPMLVACIGFALRVNETWRKALIGTILWGCVYFGWGFIGKWHHEARVHETLQQHGIEVTRIISNPTPFNTILWRVLAQDAHDNVYEAYSGWFDQKPPEFRPIAQQSALAQPIWDNAPLLQRLHWFTDGWLAYEIRDDLLVVTDLRMGYLGVSPGFQFAIAEQQNGRWQAITPKRLGKRGFREPAPEGMWRNLWQRMQGQKALFETTTP